MSEVHGEWTRCSCGHIAQDHDENGKCTVWKETVEWHCTCRCKSYDGHVISDVKE